MRARADVRILKFPPRDTDGQVVRTLRITKLLIVAQASLAAVVFFAGLRSIAADTNLLPTTSHVLPPAASDAEQNQQDLEAAARRNINLIGGQLSELEQAYQRERQRVQDSGPFSDRTMWIILAGLASLSLLLALGFGWAHRHALRRLSDEVQDLRARSAVLSERIQEQHEKAPPSRQSSSKQKAQSMDEREPAVPDGNVADDFVGKQPAPVTAAMTESHGPEKKAPLPTPDHFPAPVLTLIGKLDSTTRLELVLGKAQTYANLGQMEPALSCYDEALALAPQHAETLVKRGKTLEQLGRLDQAIESYDRAIAAAPSLATAYLLKAGVLNRLERYGEALKCYDLALRTRHTNLPV